MPCYQRQLAIFTPKITSAIPPDPLFSLLINIPQVTFPICVKNNSLTGLSMGDLDSSLCGITFSVRTGRKKQGSRNCSRVLRFSPKPGN